MGRTDFVFLMDSLCGRPDDGGGGVLQDQYLEILFLGVSGEITALCSVVVVCVAGGGFFYFLPQIFTD